MKVQVLFNLVVLLTSCGICTPASIPKLPKDVWKRLTEDIQQRAREQWARSPMDEQGEWSQWLFASPISPPPSSPVPAFRAYSEDPYLSPAIIDEEFTPFFTDKGPPNITPPLQGTSLTPIFEVPDDTLAVQSKAEETSPSTAVAQAESRGEPRGRKGLYDETREHACEVCGKRYDRAEHLKRHHRSVHTDEKPFPCGVCGKSFSRGDNRDAHIKIHNVQSK